MTLQIERAGPGHLLAFGLPLVPGTVLDERSLRVSFEGAELEARVDELLANRDRGGTRTSLRAVRVQVPAPTSAAHFAVRVEWQGGGRRATSKRVPFSSPEVSREVELSAETASRTIVQQGRGAALVETGRASRRLFTAREPHFAVRFPEGYLAATGLLGMQVTAQQVAAGPLRGLRYLSDAVRSFTLAATYDQPYALDPAPDSVPDPLTQYEGWLYDRCATFLLAYVHTGEARLGRHGLRTCSWYASRIRADGVFAGKPDPDPKYSHARGLFAYYALTGDEAALAAGRAVAGLWLADTTFVAPYRAGRLRGPDKLWTERLLGTSLEGLFYGYALTGERRFLDAFEGLFETAYRHVTGGPADLEAINPGAGFPPQDCFVHTAEQQGEGDARSPWCSGWMSVMVVDPLLRWQELSGDPRVDELIIRLARYLRDTGTSYFDRNPVDDTFLAPAVCDDPSDVENRRRLVPIYGAARGRDGFRRRSAEWDDAQHCPDATIITAAALRALVRRGTTSDQPVGPFRSEAESFLQLHHELSACAKRVIAEQVRPKRDPASWTARELLPGLADPARFLRENRIGYPTHVLSPQRRVSWWFNSALEQYSLLADAGVTIVELRPGRIRGAGCR